MKNIGVIFAMDEEIDAFLKNVKLTKEYKIFNISFYECSINNKKVTLAKSGVGKVNAARCAQIMIDNMKLDCIFNIGVAGSTSKDIEIGDIVIGEKLVQHDFDLTAFNHEKGYITNVGSIYIDSDPFLVGVAEKAEINTKVHKGVIASGDIFCTEEKMSQKIANKFNALCVEMEGASIAQVCFLSKIPFLVIRSISDSPNGNNKVDFDEFLQESSKRVALYLNNIIQKI